MMPVSKKTILLALLGVILIGGAVFYAISQKNKAPTPAESNSLTFPEGSVPSASNESGAVVTPEPTKDAPSDAIVDYLVDGLSQDETKAAEATINATKEGSSATVEVKADF